MNTAEFKENYEIDTTAKGLRGTQKNAPPQMTVALTADQKPWSHGPVYHFWDGEKIRTSEHLRWVDAENLGSMGLRIIAINKLRLSKDDAATDAQKILLDQIEKLREKIRDLESEKSPKGRTLKFILMAQ